MSNSPFDPLSSNAMFACILQRLDQQDASQATFREEMRETFKDTKDRVSVLERESWKNRGIAVGLTLAVSAAWHWLTSSRSS